MTILASDIKLRASKVMADVPEGGGGPAARVIGWNESNTIFDDVDTVARTLFAPQELPVGVVTALVGVPIFVLILARRKRYT